jgi:hypothetical protein
MRLPFPMMMIGAGGSGGSVLTTWNPSDKEAHITLSGGNLISTLAVGNTGGVRGTVARSSGKYYFEVGFTFSGSPTIQVGLAPSGKSLTALGASGFIACARAAGFEGDATGGGSSFPGFVTTNVINLAVDLDNSLLWVGVNGTYNFGDNENPNTGANGQGFSTSVPLFPYTIGSTSGSDIVSTANFGASAFANSIPTGFTAWNG